MMQQIYSFFEQLSGEDSFGLLPLEKDSQYQINLEEKKKNTR